MGRVVVWLAPRAGVGGAGGCGRRACPPPRFVAAAAAPGAQQQRGGAGPGGRQQRPRPGQHSRGGRGGRGEYAPPSPLHVRQRQQPQPQQRAPPPRDDYFYAQAATSFEDLGLGGAVSAALRGAGFARPSRVQELAAPPLLAGRDIVLAAETGSGKTVAYLAPLASLLLARRAAADAEAAAAAAAAAADPEGAPDARSAAIAAAIAESRRPVALVLVPNAALASQVLAAAESLRGADGAPLLRAAAVSSRSPPPFDRPDLVVTTPGALAALLRDGVGYGYLWTPEGLALAVAHVVVDEADLLLTGSYERDLNNILELFKVAERRAMEDAAADQLHVSPDAIRALGRIQKMALWEGGVRGLLAAGWRRAGGARGSEQLPDGVPDAAAALRKQYAFVAATMPAFSKEDAGSELARRYKAAAWIAGDLLHQSKPALSHEWVDVTGDAEWAGALLRAVTGDEDWAAGRARVLVFARDVGSANAVSDLFRSRGVPHHLYHKAVPEDKRQAALAAMAAAAGGGADGADGGGSTDSGGGGSVVVVSTDAAARGIDLPCVTHVVQADFATNAVDFLHRIGRTARADRGGRVTSLVSPEAAALAGAIRAYIEEGRPVEGAFSRNRSFSRKVKRYGEFVPRGQAGPGADAPRGGGGGGESGGERDGGGGESGSDSPGP
ncbi:DEAD-box ATP-dependent RNA helicase [Raphidocelis subcapitata]|uniref:DEAD-box ATP-dependent RNA helicase n=1 Tax=Raphidocelis subcapitata TaxID=307507 RepID=A0A2V0P3B5_9CHLO|nr:DEAD-box ATP-dependent RNA helicase [Raphidocelis subcapitata]|eukprot:GBF91565.1 DEAD-box ATP-dependent RNA helicase [Raphidocelis subcapitata]